jgi:molybdate transport system ATP-binding protein
MLNVRIRHPLGRIALDIEFDAGSGLTALVGPSGAGKTSILNVIAGLTVPKRGWVQLDDAVLVDTERGVFRPPHERHIGYVFQEPRLFPHLTVLRNLRYGAWFGGARAPKASFDDVVSLLELEPLLHRRPSRLSGGEQQRVALGRALLSRPRLLLLDEPLVAIDAARKQEILPYLDRLRHELALPTIYVTHAWSDVESRAERTIEIHEGRLVRSLQYQLVATDD